MLLMHIEHVDRPTGSHRYRVLFVARLLYNYEEQYQREVWCGVHSRARMET